MKKITILMSLVLVVALLALAGCTTTGTTAASSAAATNSTAASASSAAPSETVAASASATENAKTLKVGFSMSSKAGVIYQAYEDYLVRAGKESNPSIEFYITVADSDPGKQSKDVQDLISRKPDAMVLMAQDSTAIVSSIKACKDANIPVVMYDRPETKDAAVQSDAICMIDSTAQGYNSGKAVFEMMKKDGITEIKAINILGDLIDENAVNRSTGFKKAAEEAGVTILQEVPTKWDNDQALSGLSAALQTHSDANMIFIPSDYLIPGVQAAMERAKKWIPYGQEGHVYVGSCDCYPSGIDLVKTGYIDANPAYDIWGMASAVVDSIVKLTNGQKIENRINLINPPLVTAENVNTIKNIWGLDYKEQ